MRSSLILLAFFRILWFESRLALFLIAESFAESRLSASVIAETFGNSTAVNSKNEFHLPQKSASTLRILRKTVQI